MFHVTLQATGVFFIVFTKFISISKVSSDTESVLTTSTSCITGTGLKKCRPPNLAIQRVRYVSTLCTDERYNSHYGLLKEKDKWEKGKSDREKLTAHASCTHTSTHNAHTVLPIFPFSSTGYVRDGQRRCVTGKQSGTAAWGSVST